MTIRKAENNKYDCNLVFNLSNDPVVRSCSFNTNLIEYENHCKWYEKRLNDINTLFLLVFDEDNFVGQIRFNRESENDYECIISLSITEAYRGKHIASIFLKIGIEELKKNWEKIHTIVAEVKNDNIASNKLFIKENFTLYSSINTYIFNL